MTGLKLLRKNSRLSGNFETECLLERVGCHQLLRGRILIAIYIYIYIYIYLQFQFLSYQRQLSQKNNVRRFSSILHYFFGLTDADKRETEIVNGNVSG